MLKIAVASCLAIVTLLCAACGAASHSTPASQRPIAAGPATDTDPQILQSTVMSMSDDWNIALGESMFVLQSAPGISMQTRFNGESFLRNGMGASLDIAVGPNPRVAMLDLLVLATLQTWALEHTWAGNGIPGNLVGPAKERLAEARGEMTSKASRFLAAEQLRELDRLINAWIEAHPRQVLVSFVRLSDFASDRNELTLEDRKLAYGLLKEVDEVTSAIDDARLLGERALWYAARYPYVIGQQAELTSLRVTDIVSHEITVQREAFFAQLGRERAETIRLIEESRKDLVPVMAEARETIASAKVLSEQVLRIVQAIDGLVARFDHPGDDSGGVTTQDIKDILKETGASADKLAALVKAGDSLVESPTWRDAAAGADRFSTTTIDRLLWGSAGIVALLIGGLALVRLIPQRVRNS
ncbi:MAG: hypothetical protein LW625_05715 [Planctomycetaceae bacterium]|nr:hypothetical protein [Planctomycetaceae bacterium]